MLDLPHRIAFAALMLLLLTGAVWVILLAWHERPRRQREQMVQRYLADDERIP